MFLNPALSAALDRITERAADVRRAFVPGSVPQHDDVATPAAISDFTLDPLSVCAAGGLYFVARDARGETGFTSDGSFALHNGRLEDRDGRAICGLDGSSRLVELRVDPIDEALGRAANARVEADGSLAYDRTSIDPRSGIRESRRIVAGRLALARFPAGTRLSESDGLHIAPPGVDAQLGGGTRRFCRARTAPSHAQPGRLGREPRAAERGVHYVRRVASSGDRQRPPRQNGDGSVEMNRRVREWVVTRRSSLPVSAACVVANGVRESLAALFAAPVELHVVEPSIPRRCAWPTLLRDALLYRIRGSVAEAIVVLRPDDAATLAAALFGEPPSRGNRRLSPFERDVLDRTIGMLAAHLGSVCGTRESLGAERVDRIERLATYFELSLLEPVVARIGIALTRDPSSQPQTRIEAAHLAEIPIATRVRFALGPVSSRAIAALAAGATLPVSRRTAPLHARSVRARARARNVRARRRPPRAADRRSRRLVRSDGRRW
ncbi:MAG TPA: hypothetical protein VGG51_12435 [Candidatus Cybelea sp.]|jgi:hypothetical protein